MSDVINTEQRMRLCCCLHSQWGGLRPLEGKIYWLMMFGLAESEWGGNSTEGQTGKHLCPSLQNVVRACV